MPPGLFASTTIDCFAGMEKANTRGTAGAKGAVVALESRRNFSDYSCETVRCIKVDDHDEYHRGYGDHYVSVSVRSFEQCHSSLPCEALPDYGFPSF
jgi:hypothetical protein